MGKKIECRVSEEYYNEVREYAKGMGVSITDVVINGINSQLHGNGGCPDKVVMTEKHGVEPCPDKGVDKPVEPVVVREFVNKAVEYKVTSGGFFRPMPKAEQTRNNGKGKK